LMAPISNMTMRVYQVDRYGVVSRPLTVTAVARGPLSFPAPAKGPCPPGRGARCADRLGRGGRRNALGVADL
jgi:hypothetical protein